MWGWQLVPTNLLLSGFSALPEKSSLLLLLVFLSIHPSIKTCTSPRNMGGNKLLAELQHNAPDTNAHSQPEYYK